MGRSICEVCGSYEGAPHRKECPFTKVELPVRLRRIEAGAYETRDGKYRVFHWDETAGNRKSWAVGEWDGKTWDFVCEVLTLGDARLYLAGEDVFILS